jgi:SPP1 family predicted phage head-tail adaptor
MEAGKLRHRVTIQTATSAQDATGYPVKTWGTLATVWAMVLPLQGRELVAAQQAQSESTVHIRTRYLSGVTTKDRILFGTRVYEINGIVNPGERNIELQFLCKEVL